MRFAPVALSGALLVAAGCGGKQPTAASRVKLTAKDIYQQSSAAIVRIDVTDPHGARVGTGFIVDRGGLVATNLHVVGGSDKIKIKTGDGHEYDVREVVGYDKNRDLALLRIQSPIALPAIRLGDSDALIPGDQIVAIGNPLGFENTVSAGLISSVRVFCTPEQAAAAQCPDTNNIDLKYLQISAPISQGSSGGPLFNQFGEVVGITTGIIDGGQSINIAVPANYLKVLLARPGRIAITKFATDTLPPEEVVKDGDEPKIVRVDPNLHASVYDGCGEDDIKQLVQDIGRAIESGAPLYNTKTSQGYEACFRIYEGTALHWHDGKCKGVSAAFDSGLSRAGTLRTFNEKAWALRDTFDGLIGAAEEWAQVHPELLQKQPAPPR
jgi:S1-C subfamily serine protease